MFHLDVGHNTTEQFITQAFSQFSQRSAQKMICNWYDWLAERGL